MLALLGLSISGAQAQTTYTITKNGADFNVAISGSSLSFSNFILQAVINDIKTNAAGNACTIQFGNGSVLDLGGGSSTLINFDGGSSGNDWGMITLTGKATSANTSQIIALNNNVSIDCKAELIGTGTGILIYNNSTGTATISGGEVNGGNSFAIYNASAGKISVEGNGIVTSNANSSKSTICLAGESNGYLLDIFDNATIKNTADGGIAIRNDSKGTVYMGGTCVQATTGVAIQNNNGNIEIQTGTVQATGNNGRAIDNVSTGLIFINGGTVSASTGIAVNTNSGRIIVSGDALITSENTTEGTISVGMNTSDKPLIIEGGTVENTTNGVAVYSNSPATVEINNGTVKNTSPNGSAILNVSTGTISITGGTVEANTGVAIYNLSAGKITVSDNALITSESTSFGTIFLNSSGSATAERLVITGGTVKNTTTQTTGHAIRNNSPGTVRISGGAVSATTGYAISSYHTGTLNINGGTVQATTGYAVYLNHSAGTVNISGGTVRATTGDAVRNNDAGAVNITGGILFAYGTEITDLVNGNYTYNNSSSTGILAAWNQAAGKVNYVSGTSEDIFIFPDEAKAVWDIDNDGILLSYNGNIGILPIEGLTISPTGIEELQAANDELRVYPNPTGGMAYIQTENDAVLQLYDLQGKLLLATTGKQIDLSAFAAGMYLLKVNGEMMKVVKK